MPGRTAGEAQDAFLEPLRRCLSCVTKAQLLVSPPPDGGEHDKAFTLSQDPLPLRTQGGRGLRLRLRHQYRLVEDTAAPRAERWHASTVAYHYRLDRGDGTELLSWHWHPRTGVPFPHMHVGVGAPLSLKAHLPTGRVSVESVLRLLLSELGVPPKRKGWAKVIDDAEKQFLKHRRWSGHSPEHR